MKKKLLLLPIFALLLAGCGSDQETSTISEPDSLGGIEFPSEDEILEPSEDDSVVLEDFNAIGEIRKLNDDTIVTTGGVITSKYVGAANGNYSITIQDGEDALLLYAVEPAIADTVKVGDSIKVTGKKTTYQNDGQLSDVTEIVKADTPFNPVEPLDVSATWVNADMLKQGARLVKIVEIKVDPLAPELVPGSPESVNRLEFKAVPDTNGPITIFVPQHVGWEVVNYVATSFNGMNRVLDTISVVGTMAQYNGNAQIFVTSVENFVVNKGEAVGPAVTGVTIAPKTLSLDIGGSSELSATVEPADAGNPVVSYSSSNESVARVDSFGKVTGVGEGDATITVTTEDGGFEDTAEVSVSGVIDANVLTPAQAHTKAKGDKVSVYGKVVGNTNVGRNVYAIQIDDTGIMTFQTPGLTVGNDVIISGEIDVYNNLIQITNPTSTIDLGPSTQVITPKVITDLTQLTANTSGTLVKLEGLKYVNGTYQTGEHQNVNATFGEKNVVLRLESGHDQATVDAHNNFFASLGGVDTFNVTAIQGWYKDDPQIMIGVHSIFERVQGVVSNPVTGVSLDVADVNLDIGALHQLTATVEPAAADNKAVSFTSSDETIAKVSNEGLVTAVGAGVATITVTTEDGGFSATAQVTVSENLIATLTPAQAHAAAVNSDIIVKGKVVEQIKNGQYAIQDGDVGIMTYFFDIPLTVGNDVIIYGTLGNFNGLHQITNATAVIDLGPSTTAVTPRVVTNSAELTQDVTGSLVTIDGLSLVSGRFEAGNKNAMVKVLLGEVEIDLRAENVVTEENINAFNAFLDGLAPDATFSLTAHLGWYDQAQLAFTNSTVYD